MSQAFERTEHQPSLGDKLAVASRILKATAEHPSGMISLMTGRGDKPMGASIDIAANCNLRCQHCYLFEKGHQEEGIDNDADFLSAVRKFRQDYPAVIQCTWVGGEPMFRKSLLQEGVKMFPTNWVVTNGTIPIDGEWPFTAFFISIDGTEDVHNQIRKPWKPSKPQAQPTELPMLGKAPAAPSPVRWNVYQRAKQHANEATAPVHVHTVINQLNAPTIPALVEEWRDTSKVRGFAFSLHTPMVDQTRESGMPANDERLYIGGDQRREVVDMLHGIKRQHGRFVMMSDRQIDDYLPENTKDTFDSNCRVVNAVASVDSQFQRKAPCVMGEGMDCSKCGCVIPTIMERTQRFDLEAMKLTFATLIK